METYRFNIQNYKLKNEMIKFASYHKHETNSILKESFEKWIKSENINILIQEEINLLKNKNYNLGHEFSIENKIFRSIKYYHMKKNEKTSSCVKKIKSKIKIDKNIIDIVKQYLIRNCNEKPSESYNSFITIYKTIIDNEKQKFLNNHVSEHDFHYLFKKMYKNAHYNIIKTCII